MIRVSAAVIRDRDRVLATRRGYGDCKGCWEFPGGKREEGETGEEAVIREIREELDADISVDGFLCTIEHQYDGFLLVMDCYLSHIAGGAPSLIEHEAMRWLSAAELDSVDWLPADRKVLGSVRDMLS